MVAINLLERITRTRDPIDKEKHSLLRGVLSPLRYESGEADYEPRLPLNRKRPYGCFHVFSLKYFIFLLTRPYGHTLTLHSLANKSYDYE